MHMHMIAKIFRAKIFFHMHMHMPLYFFVICDMHMHVICAYAFDNTDLQPILFFIILEKMKSRRLYIQFSSDSGHTFA